MRERQKLERVYHGHKIISIQNEEPVENSDGFSHTVYDKSNTLIGGTYSTLGQALKTAKYGVNPDSTLSGTTTWSGDDAKAVVESLNEETETELPETEEHE